MTRVVLDVETASLVDLRQTGVHVYAADPSTRVTVLCYAIDAGPIRTWTGGPCPADLFAAIAYGATVVAHNYLFELNIWAAKLIPLGFPAIMLKQWSCTMARALAAGLPAGLEMVGHALGLAIQKDATARDLMLRFARPRSLNPLTWWHETDIARFARLAAYCARDVATERELDKALPELSPREREIFETDYEINTRGMRVNLVLVDKMHALGEHEKRRLNGRLVSITNGRVTSAAQVARLVVWLNDNRIAVPVTPSPYPGMPGKLTLDREAVTGMLRRPGLPDHVRAALRCRLDASRSSTAKLTTIRRSVDQDHRLRGTTQYYGAGRTGRWAGRRFQPQNLPRGTISDIGTAVSLIEAGAPAEDLELLFEDSAMGVLASALRSVIEAGPGNLLVACDLSQIEARVLVWLAGQEDMVGLFARGEDVYTYTAGRLGSPNRQFGKVLVLACGFGMGAGRFQATAAGYGVSLSLGEADDAVQAWRSVNTKVVDLWWDLHRTAMRVLSGPVGSRDTVRGLIIINARDGMRIKLPSGRDLIYRDARIVRHPEHRHPEIVYMGVEQGRWVDVRTWPGKLVENIVQAIARDVMCESLILAHRRRVPVVATVHDELVAEIEASRAQALHDWMTWAMCRPLVWAPGLPVAAEARVGPRYRKAA
jgi:DNA polymerase